MAGLCAKERSRFMAEVHAAAQPPRIALAILAAGASSRMGQLKQLLPIAGTPLVAYVAQKALQSQAWPVIVVLGRDAALIRPLLRRWPLLVDENEQWQLGIGSSIRAAVRAAQRFSGDLDGIIISVGDQPQISAAAYDSLIKGFRGPTDIVAARYAGTLGTPVLFGSSYLPELNALNDSEGAQRLLRTHAAAVNPIDLPELAEDLDTPEDYARFTSRT
jgi:molybdenum cofactor cytidylyltransferase